MASCPFRAVDTSSPRSCNRMVAISRLISLSSTRSAFLYIKILVSEQGNVIFEKIELSQFVGYQERQKGLS